MSQEEKPPAETGSFIVALIIGLCTGGTILTLMVFVIGLAVVALIDAITHRGTTLLAVLISYAIAVAFAVRGFSLTRKHVDFVSGFVVGAAAGLLGGISICSGIGGGLNNLH